jgi:O-antigen/teichoic acid export membrane protein
MKPGAEGRLDKGSLWQGFARGVRDSFAAEFTTQALRVGGMIVLARALEPRHFGVFRVLLVISVVAGLINEAGLPDALIQREDLRPVHEATAWWAGLILTASSTLGLYFSAPLLARVMGMPELAWAVRLLCIPQLIDGTALTANARLQRNLKFGAVALAEVTAEIAFIGTALAMLRLGHDDGSLPAALAMRLAVHGIMIWIAGGWPALARPRLEAAGQLSGFAGTVLGGRLVCLLSNNADYLVVGRLLGSTVLGFYSIAWDLLRFIPDRLYKIAGRVALPTFCRLQNDDRELGRAYLHFFNYIARIVLPVVGCVVIAAPEVITTIYGAKWEPAATAMRFLGSGLMLVGLNVGVGPIYYTKGSPSVDLYLHSLRLVLVVGVCMAFSGWGLRGVGAAMSAVEGVIGLMGCGLAGSLIGLSFSDLAAAAGGGVRLAVACMAATAGGKAIASLAGLSGPFALLLIVLFPAALFIWSEAPGALAMLVNAFGSVERANAG